MFLCIQRGLEIVEVGVWLEGQEETEATSLEHGLHLCYMYCLHRVNEALADVDGIYPCHVDVINIYNVSVY